jgi:hypothetical protein
MEKGLQGRRSSSVTTNYLREERGEKGEEGGEGWRRAEKGWEWTWGRPELKDPAMQGRAA